MTRSRRTRNVTTVAMERVLSRAHLLFDAEQVDRAVDQLSVRISVALHECNPILVCVMNGGVSLMGDLLRRLHFPLEVDYVHATRYANSTSGNVVSWLAEPHLACADREVLIVDDILDEGITLEAVVRRFRAQGASAVYTAVLLDKDIGRARPIAADFAAMPCPDRYVFGRGMDYQGYWRNLRAVYALDETEAP